MTWFYKRVFPVIWFAFGGLFLIGASFGTHRLPALTLPFILMPFLVMAVGYLVVRHMLKGLVDEVWDNSKELLVVNEGHVEHVPLSDIVNISYSGLTNPKRATLQLRPASRWGEKRVFIPPRGSVSIFNLMDNPVVDELVRRVDEARQTS